MFDVFDAIKNFLGPYFLELSEEDECFINRSIDLHCVYQCGNFYHISKFHLMSLELTISNLCDLLNNLTVKLGNLIPYNKFYDRDFIFLYEIKKEDIVNLEISYKGNEFLLDSVEISTENNYTKILYPILIGPKEFTNITRLSIKKGTLILTLTGNLIDSFIKLDEIPPRIRPIYSIIKNNILRLLRKEFNLESCMLSIREGLLNLPSYSSLKSAM